LQEELLTPEQVYAQAQAIINYDNINNSAYLPQAKILPFDKVTF
jgi:hypothetical protein